MTEQLEVAMLLGGGLSAAGFVRVYVTNGSLLNAFAISVSLLAIVFASVLFGTGLPFALARGGVDPAHAGTSIQVCTHSRCWWEQLFGTLLGWHAATSPCTDNCWRRREWLQRLHGQYVAVSHHAALT
jgi:hypothetical protein